MPRTTLPASVQVCTKCGVEKPLSEFYVRKDTLSGFRRQCKACVADQNQVYYKTEQGRAVHDAYQRSDAGKATRKKYARTEKGKRTINLSRRRYIGTENGKRVIKLYTGSDADKRSKKKHARTAKYWSTRRAYINSVRGKAMTAAADHRYKQTEKGRLVSALKEQRRRARKCGAAVGVVDSQKVYDLYENQCVYCGSPEKLTLDHVVPLSKGGAHAEDNLVVACKSCNSSKGAKPVDVWLNSRPLTIPSRVFGMAARIQSLARGQHE